MAYSKKVVDKFENTLKNPDKFNAIINKGTEYALNNQIVTFGIPPKYPETGFGYIEAEKSSDFIEGKATSIKRFIEKPNKKKAEELILNEKYSWNSGIFLMRANVVLSEMQKLAPEVLLRCDQSLEECYKDLDFLRIGKKFFNECPDISFDKAIMEKTKLGIVFLLDIDWSDVGSWDSISKISKKDDDGNSLIGNVLMEKTSNCYVRSESKLVVGLEIENLIIVETIDAVLVTRKESSQKVKDIVDLLKKRNFNEATSPKKTYRPWGNYLPIENGNNWQVKRIEVNPNCSLSLQMHQHRAEHWIVVSGEAFVKVDDKELILVENQSTFIPVGSKHRLSNKQNKPLIIIEVQSGKYLGEDDIIRFEDDFGRK